MSSEIIYKCDHCGAKCKGDEYASIGRWDEPGIIVFGKTVHGCSKEHLGIALAKMFGIGVNGEADELLNRKQRELTKLTDANNFLVTERDNMRDRVAELEKRIAKLTAPVTVDGKTPQDTVDALRRVRERIDSDPYPDVRSLRHIDEELAKLEAKPAQCPPDTSTESGLPDAVLAAITLPTKPTKPLRARLEELATYWETGAASSSMSEGYRQASKDCAKELREAIDDPR